MLSNLDKLKERLKTINKDVADEMAVTLDGLMERLYKYDKASMSVAFTFNHTHGTGKITIDTPHEEVELFLTGNMKIRNRSAASVFWVVVTDERIACFVEDLSGQTLEELTSVKLEK